MLRHGASHWECGIHVNAAAEGLLTLMLMPNLVWRAGRVEATIR